MRQRKGKNEYKVLHGVLTAGSKKHLDESGAGDSNVVGGKLSKISSVRSML